MIDASHAISPSSCSQSCNIAHPLGNCHCRFNSRGTIGFSTDARHNDAGSWHLSANIGESAGLARRRRFEAEAELAGMLRFTARALSMLFLPSVARTRKELGDVAHDVAHDLMSLMETLG